MVQTLLLVDGFLLPGPVVQSESVSTLEGGLLGDPAHKVQNRLKVSLLDAARVVVAAGERLEDLDGRGGQVVQLLHVDRPGIC